MNTFTNDTAIVNDIIKSIRSVIGENSVALHEPHFAGNEWAYVKECLDTGWVSSVGKYVDLFEHKLAEFTGVKRAIAVVNGTAALQICLKLAGVSDHDEVLVPSLSFVATANAVHYCNAIPHFVDSEYETLGLDAKKLDGYLAEISSVNQKRCINNITGRQIKAVVPMHTFGHPVNLDAIVEVCNKYHLVLIEDAAESLGSYYKDKHTGQHGLLSALSFNGNKIMTTGGGGAILTNDESLANYAKHLTTTAKKPHKWAFVHDYIGYNYRLPNINAALGCAQLEQLPTFLEKKRELAIRYESAFKTVPNISFVKEPNMTKSNYWLNALLLDSKESLEPVLEATNKAGIMTRPAWNLLHSLPINRDCPLMPDMQVSNDLASRLINIPSSVGLI